MRKWIFIIILCTLGISILSIAPFLQYSDASRAHPEPGIAYDVLTNQLNEVTQKKDAAEKTAGQAIDNAKRLKRLMMEKFSETNAYSSSTIIKGIEEIQRERSQRPQGTPSPRQIIQDQTEDARLEQIKQQAERQEACKNHSLNLRGLWEEVFNEVQAMATDFASKCGGATNEITLPSIDDICSGQQKPITLNLGPNCDWACVLSFSQPLGDERVMLTIQCSGARSKGTSLNMHTGGGNLDVNYYGGVLNFSKAYALEPRSNCVASLDYMLELLKAAEQDGFEPTAK